ncbi:MAG: NAD(P)H-hydrate dehydratase [Pseudomonadota bacterium]|nr:NAD(P)H-hydrate dehydratase [Pseudomonadota bacterium]
MTRAPAPPPAFTALYDLHALRGLEARAAQLLDDPYEPMRRAGQAAWRAVLAHWPQAQRLLVVCGSGNNGGDGYVLARHAHQSGRRVTVIALPQGAPRAEMASRAFAEYTAAGGLVEPFQGRLDEADLVIDGLLGIGMDRAPQGACAEAILAINAHPAPVFALDVPSGIDASTGAAPGVAVVATRTLEFLAPKAGLRTGAALDHVGGIDLAELGLPARESDDATPFAEMLVADDLSRWLRRRLRDSHKGDHGRVLCVGGDHGRGGAIVMAAEAALRSGAGLVDVATRPAHVSALLARLPEAMGHALDDEGDCLAGGLLESADVIAAGPGLGRSRAARIWLAQVLDAGKALVLDADALNLLAETPQFLHTETVLTPHPGEAARLLGVDTARVQQDRYAAALAICQDHGCVVVLKGAGTMIAAPGRVPRVIAAGNPGMAVGGMGDVLTGVIAALRAQGYGAFDAAALGALLHAAAGDAVAADSGERGLLPTDLMPWLRRLGNPEPRP